MAGDEQAIESLVRQHEADIFKLALSITNDPLDAREIAQETFIMALKSLHSYEERSSFQAWLRAIALNLSRSHLRKRKSIERLKTALTLVLRLESQKPFMPEDIVVQNEKEQLIWQAVSGMDDKHRIPLILRYFHDLSVAEISEMLDVKEGTIHSRLHFARERLRIELKKSAGE